MRHRALIAAAFAQLTGAYLVRPMMPEERKAHQAKSDAEERAQRRKVRVAKSRRLLKQLNGSRA